MWQGAVPGPVRKWLRGSCIPACLPSHSPEVSASSSNLLTGGGGLSQGRKHTLTKALPLQGHPGQLAPALGPAAVRQLSARGRSWISSPRAEVSEGEGDHGLWIQPPQPLSRLLWGQLGTMTGTCHREGAWPLPAPSRPWSSLHSSRLLPHLCSEGDSVRLVTQLRLNRVLCSLQGDLQTQEVAAASPGTFWGPGEGRAPGGSQGGPEQLPPRNAHNGKCWLLACVQGRALGPSGSFS